MLKKKETGLEEYSFGDERGDLFYILVNKKISPDGIDIKKLSAADPRNFDAVLTEMGCILMLNGIEVDELVRRGELDKNNLHQTMFELAEREGLL
ncbi:hypothetical protein [Gracilimonas mengyeensis]|uniref:Uncharacterized protein n=1 Tax=Gracilimonas mengyeensis TaxID=1302730 RepID=A0A521CNW2_9BACT|nr:hypothetical protein [Gracilimonas mengyeensis]SMO61144.1 hypothetical protein SAMN06265219_10634 [Gracilimonas mengyeensis]